MRGKLKNQQYRGTLGYGLVGAVIAVLLNAYHPFTSLFPTKDSEWVVVFWEQLIFAGVNGFFISAVFYLLLKRQERQVRQIVKFAVLISVLRVIGEIIYIAINLSLFWLTRSHGAATLLSNPDFYFYLLWRFTYPYVSSLLTGGLAVALLGSIYVKTKARLIGKLEIWIGFWMGFVLDWERMIVALGIALLAMVFSSVIKHKEHTRMAPYLLLAFFLSMPFGNQVINWFFSLI